MKYIRLCVFFITFSLVNCSEVLTTIGRVKGKFNNGTISYYSFEGIPYAESPTGNRRFMPPVPVQSSKKLIDATKPAHVCQQPPVMYKYEEMSEDCLFLNIFTPKLQPITSYPVLIYIPGGVFCYGSGNAKPILGPQNMMKNNIIVVTINYRVGVFGFLSLGTEEASGNAGLKDIDLAINWINKNIEKFGGDRRRITLGGLGSGAMLASYLLLTGQMRNKQKTELFQRVLLLSGTALSYRAKQIDCRGNVEKLAKKLYIEYKNDNELLQKLKEADAVKINEAELTMVNEVPNRAFVYNTQFTPRVEKNTTNAIITMDPVEATKAGLTKDVPVLLGIVEQEGVQMFPVISNKALKKYPNLINNLNENFELCIPPNIDYPVGSQERKKLATSIREKYFNGGNITLSTTNNYVNMLSDTAFCFPADYWVKLQCEQNRISPIYYYKNILDTVIGWFKANQNITYPGTAHADDISIFFVPTSTESKYKKLDSKELTAISIIQNYVFNFIKHGNPSPPVSLTQSVKWTKACPQRAHIVLGETITMVPNAPFKDRLKFWYQVYADYDKWKAAHKKVDKSTKDGTKNTSLTPIKLSLLQPINKYNV